MKRSLLIKITIFAVIAMALGSSYALYANSLHTVSKDVPASVTIRLVDIPGLTLNITDKATGLPDATIPAGGQVTMTVDAQQTDAMQGLQFKVIYDPAIVSVESVVKGGIPDGFLFQENTGIPGEVSIALVGDAAAGVSGFDVVDIVFSAIGAPGQSTALTFAETIAGDSSTPPQPMTVLAIDGSIAVNDASTSAILFRPDVVGLGAIGSVTTAKVVVEDISPEVNGIQLNLQHPETLEVSSPACVGVFAGGFTTPLAPTDGGTLLACALIGAVSDTSGDAMTFELTRVGDFEETQVVTFGIGGPDGTQLSISGIGEPPGTTNDLVVHPRPDIPGVTTLQFVNSSKGVELTLTGDGFSGEAAADVDGDWSLFGVPEGIYTLTASAPTFLSSQLTGLVVGVSEDIIVPTNELLAGDINGNAFVEINDITGIIGNFGKGAPQAWSGDPTVGAGTGVISGVTQPQFMSDSSFVALTLTGIGVSQTTMADAAGNWAFPAVPAGEYTLKASALSHISTERTSVVLGSDENLEIPSNVLLAGDINGNNFIEINDITGTIGNFGKDAPQPWPVP